MSMSKKRKLESADNSDAPSLKKSKQSGSTKSSINKNGAVSVGGPWESPEAALSWLLKDTSSNIGIKKFFAEYFGQKPLLIKRNDNEYYSKQDLDLTLNKIKQISNENELYHGRDIVSKYCKNENEECPEWLTSKQDTNSQFLSDEISKIFKDGCTMQYHHPQHKYYELMHFVYLLESYFKVLVGSNVYLTPNETQGLAPHWDDVDVWILQIEGEKHWKLYSNGSKNNCQPIESSGDLNLKQDFPNAKLLMECDLAPGDLLYLPRGTIHCAQATKNDKCDYSNHLTISSHQRSTIGHFEQLALKRAMDQILTETEIDERYAEHRRTIDCKNFSHIGSSLKTNSSNISNNIVNTLIKSNHLQAAIENVTKDTVDQVYIDFTQHRLPPISKINYIDGILFGNPKNKQIVESRMKEDSNEKELDLGTITKSTKINFINRDWLRFVDSGKHSGLLPNSNNDTNEMLAQFISDNIDNNDNKGFSFSKDSEDSKESKEDKNNNGTSLESPVIPSRKQFITSTLKKSNSKSSKSSVRVISLSDTPASKDKNDKKDGKSGTKEGSNDEIEDFDIEPTIVNQNFENEELGEGYNFENNLDIEAEAYSQPLILLYHCLYNDVQSHMTEFIDEDPVLGPLLTFPLHLRSILDVLFETYPQKVRIDTLLKKANKIDSENNLSTGPELGLDDAKEVIEELYSNDLIEIEP